MKGKKRGLSAGSVLVLLLTAAVSVCCVVMFAAFQGDGHQAGMDAQKVIRVLGDALQGPTPEAGPQPTVRTVTVTLAPPSATQAPENTPVPAHTEAVASADQGIPAMETPAAERDFSFTLTAGGVIGFQSDISDSVYQKQDKSFDYRPVFSLLGDWVHADLNLASFGNVLNVEDQKYADVFAPDDVLSGVKEAGFDLLLLNSEHVLDQGVKGARDTAQAIYEKGFSSLGISAGPSQSSGMISINGGSVAILAYTETLTAKGKNALETPEGQQMLQLFDPERARREIRAAKAQGAGCVIVCIHWGKEDSASVTQSMRASARLLAEAGADLILGAHPTRVLPMEILNCTDEQGRKRQAFVAYSLGTLLTESRDGYDISGALLHLQITCRGDGSVSFSSAEYTPTYIWRQNVNDKWQYRVVPSNALIPEGMEQKQREVMGRALSRIQETLKESPVKQRK